ncbi:MAG: hypothetical protein HRT73_11665 [Flavobacteriales bacterium]|nr:hypothetical protein [Flavobacteriales bacterium]
MNKNSLMFCCCLLLGLISCGLSNNPNNIDEIDNGMYRTVCVDSVSTNGSIITFCETFYPSEELFRTYTVEDSAMYGICKSYYKNGNLKDSCSYLSGFKYGWYKSYYANGNIKELSDYIVLAYKTDYRNQFMEFDSLTKKPIEETRYSYWFDLIPSNVEDSITVDFTFDHSLYSDSSYIEIGEYNEVFMISEGARKQTRIIPVINQKASFKFLPVDNGTDKNWMRGIVNNLSLGDSIKEHKICFSEEYKVN